MNTAVTASDEGEKQSYQVRKGKKRGRTAALVPRSQ